MSLHKGTYIPKVYRSKQEYKLCVRLYNQLKIDGTTILMKQTRNIVRSPDFLCNKCHKKFIINRSLSNKDAPIAREYIMKDGSKRIIIKCRACFFQDIGW